MLHETFNIWYTCLQILHDMHIRNAFSNEFDRFCDKCAEYHKLSDEGVHQNGDDVFTRQNYETLSRYLHVHVVNHMRNLRRDCPEWAFIISEFHNFVIEHEIQRLKVDRVWSVDGGENGFGGRTPGTVNMGTLFSRLNMLGAS